MNWFTNKGQMVQVAIQGAALLVAIKVAFPAMSSNNFFSAGAIVFYLLLVSLFVSVWLLVRGTKKLDGDIQSKSPLAKVEAGSQKPIPAVVFVVEQAYVNYTDRAHVPLKLHVIWANAGEEIHLGKPQWIAGKVHNQGYPLGQPLIHRFKVRLGKEDTESEEVTAKSEQRGELWLGLDQTVDVEQARLWRMGSQLGTLILPITVRKISMELRIRL